MSKGPAHARGEAGTSGGAFSALPHGCDLICTQARRFAPRRHPPASMDRTGYRTAKPDRAMRPWRRRANQDSPKSTIGGTLAQDRLAPGGAGEVVARSPAAGQWSAPMTDAHTATDIHTTLEELRAKAADCELLGSLATDPSVREESRRRAAEYRRLIEETEALLKIQAA